MACLRGNVLSDIKNFREESPQMNTTPAKFDKGIDMEMNSMESESIGQDEEESCK